MLCTECGNTYNAKAIQYILYDAKAKQFIISSDQDMELKFEKPTLKTLIFFHRKSRIIKYSLDLPLKNMICKYDVLWIPAAYCVVRVRLAR